MSTHPSADRTGEVYGTLEITGPGRVTVRRTTSDITGRLVVQSTEKLWRYRCQICGFEGETRIDKIKARTHRCEIAPHWRHDLGPNVCSQQCRGCGHYRELSGGYRNKGCYYILDTHHRRPKVDLRTEDCPVRDPDFTPPRATIDQLMPSKFDIIQRIYKEATKR